MAQKTIDTPDIELTAEAALILCPLEEPHPEHTAVRFGGLPRLPKGTEWPEHITPETEWTSENRLRLHFFAEIDLAGIPRRLELPEESLPFVAKPSTGTLSIFLPLMGDCLHGCDPVVLYFPQSPKELPERAAPEDLDEIGPDSEYDALYVDEEALIHPKLLPPQSVQAIPYRTWRADQSWFKKYRALSLERQAAYKQLSVKEQRRLSRSSEKPDTPEQRAFDAAWQDYYAALQAGTDRNRREVRGAIKPFLRKRPSSPKPVLDRTFTKHLSGNYHSDLHDGYLTWGFLYALSQSFSLRLLNDFHEASTEAFKVQKGWLERVRTNGLRKRCERGLSKVKSLIRQPNDELPVPTEDLSSNLLPDAQLIHWLEMSHSASDGALPNQIKRKLIDFLNSIVVEGEEAEATAKLKLLENHTHYLTTGMLFDSVHSSVNDAFDEVKRLGLVIKPKKEPIKPVASAATCDVPKSAVGVRLEDYPIQMFGVGDQIQQGRDTNADAVLLFQISDQFGTAVNLRGCLLQIWISKEDLAAGRFDRTWSELEMS